ncbi:Ariadne-like ubiquitin ligase, partial [Globisporangium splendens]
MSTLSDDEYHYSDIEEDEDQHLDDDDEEYQYSDDNASVASDSEMHAQSATSNLAHKSRSPHADSSRLSPLGASGSAAKKKRMSPGAMQNHKQAEEYRVIDEQELFLEQRGLIHEIAQVLEISPSVAAIMLRHFGWNKEKLYEVYYSDPARAQEDAGVACASKSAPKLPDGQMIVSDEIFKKFTTPDDFIKYSRYVLRSYVDINKCVKWCPSPGCNKAISSAGGLSSVSCSCGCVFCLRCGEEAHAPVTCEQLASWQEKCKNESETANWILANTKKCPKCSVRIEKNQGCNHMTCRSCTYEFCWICMESWAKHGSGTGGYYKCNRYDGEAAAGDSDAARAKAELDRYLHYYQRFANHSEAGKFAQRMRDGTESRMIELQASHGESSWIDVQFLNAATEQLIECRRVLKYTYVFGYYLPPGKEKNLFEYLQENLEKNAEHLTGLSEAPLDKMNRSEIINYTRVTETFLRNLLTGVEDGLTSAGPQ